MIDGVGSVASYFCRVGGVVHCMGGVVWISCLGVCDQDRVRGGWGNVRSVYLA